ncbi:MAG TPA: GNAT family N-acetyltransferase [Armatimonadota bacterium]|jgi:ribosomal protein S18 acetylase RimI-like enzyme
MALTLRQMDPEELRRLEEIDRTEHIETTYSMVDGVLTATHEPVDCPAWPADGGPGSWQERAQRWGEEARGGVILGAFDGDRLAGFAILRYRLTETMAQLSVLHISRQYRRQGVGTHLVTEVFRLARESGATSIYVSGAPTESAIGFYQSHGFQPTPTPHPELLALEPDDIHMVRTL